MTELSPIVTMGRTSEFKPGTCGVIVPNTEVKILPVEEEEDSGKRGDLKEGETGEIVVKGPQVCHVPMGHVAFVAVVFIVVCRMLLLLLFLFLFLFLFHLMLILVVCCIS